MTGSREIDAGKLMTLYNALASKDGTEGKALADMTADELRRYKTESKRRSRERQRLAAAAKGSPEPTAENIRHALADAAIMILATEASGAAEIKGILAIAFQGRPGVPARVVADVRSGKLKAKTVRFATPGDRKSGAA